MINRRNYVSTGRSRGFTIIELLVVVIVIGILSSAGLAKYQSFADSARKRTCCLNQSGIETAVAVWCTQNVDFSSTAEGFGRFELQSFGWYHGGWGTSGPFHNSWEIARVVRDIKMWICPSALKAANDVVGNLSGNPSYNSGCGAGNRQSQYHLYYGGVGYGSWNGSSGHWYDPAGGNTSHLMIWCGNNGCYAQPGPDGSALTRHSIKW